MRNLNTDFNEFNVRSALIQFDDEVSASSFGCVGKMSREFEVTNITKKCEGRTVLKKSKPTGEGTLTLNVHVPVAVARKMKSMLVKNNVAAQGTDIFKTFKYKCIVSNEENADEYQLYPNCALNGLPEIEIDDEAEEVAAVEMEIGFATDEYGNMYYTEFKEDLEEGITFETWDGQARWNATNG